MELIDLALSVLGLILLSRSLKPRKTKTISSNHSFPELVSVCISVEQRESSPLKKLLITLQEQSHKNIEVILPKQNWNWDISSAAKGLKLVYVDIPHCPSDWSQEAWEKQSLANHASGDFLLFTNQKLRFFSDTITRSLRFIRYSNSSAVSGLPEYFSTNFWQKCLGYYHLIKFSSTSIYKNQFRPRTLTTNDFLLIKKHSFQSLEGFSGVLPPNMTHTGIYEKVKLNDNESFGVLPIMRLYRVELDDNLLKYINEEVTCMESSSYYFGKSAFIYFLASILALISFSGSIDGFIGILAIFSALVTQNELGDFPIWSILTFPFSVLVFIYVLMRSQYHRFIGKPPRLKPARTAGR
ncbi:MAG: hypothetical protein AB8E15_12605 [Bdellovibrionales bacterium]